MLFVLCSWLFADWNLFSGESRQVPARGALWIENRKVLEGEDQGAHFVLKAKSPGKTLLRNGSEVTEVWVLSNLQRHTHQLLRNSLRETRGLWQKIFAGKIEVHGRLVRWQDWKSLAETCESSDCEYVFRARMTPDQQEKVSEFLYQQIREKAFPPIQLNKTGETFSVLTPNGIPTPGLEKFLKNYGLSLQTSPHSLEVKPLVRVQITVSEIRKGAARQLGFDWPTQISAQIFPRVGESEDQGVLTLKALEESGSATILAKPTLLCRSGETADFLAGGEIPIRILNFKTHDVVWKKYGIQLKLKPKADSAGKMSVDLDTEISTPDFSNSVDGIPSLQVHRVHSHFDLLQARTVILSGLLRQDLSQSAKGLPLLQKIPVLGQLFSSQNYLDKTSELVIWVRPEVVRPEQMPEVQTP